MKGILQNKWSHRKDKVQMISLRWGVGETLAGNKQELSITDLKDSPEN